MSDTIKYWQAVNRALSDAMEADHRVIVLGEDVAGAGGPFGATSKLLERFGPGRVRDTPISEAAIVGAAVGAAMTGLRPVAEIMFMDFMTLAMDQLVNQAAKVSYMSGGTYSAPVVVRTIVGAGRETGPQHSQSFESWLAHIPGLKVVWGSTPAAAYGLLRAAIEDEDPVVVIESLALWSDRGPFEERPYRIGVAEVLRPGTDVTVVSWGAAVGRTVQAAEDAAVAGVQAEVIDLCSISPIDWRTILDSVASTGRLLVVSDGYLPAGVGATVSDVVNRELFGQLSAPVRQVHAPFAPIPFTPVLEKEFFPSRETIKDALLGF